MFSHFFIPGIAINKSVITVQNVKKYYRKKVFLENPFHARTRLYNIHTKPTATASGGLHVVKVEYEF
jgi:hypothetical protein